jgi:hypothetical protein
MKGPLEKVIMLLGTPVSPKSVPKCRGPKCLPVAEEHQGSLYETDTELIDGWHVFGRGLTAGARTSFEVGGMGRCEVRVYMQEDYVVVEIPGGHVRMLLLSAAVLAAVKKRSGL